MPLSTEEWEEISQTIPSVDEPFIQKYVEGRDALISQENKQRSGMFRSLRHLH
jgi:adenosine deaminase CECR1